MRLQTKQEEQDREEWSYSGRPMTDAEAASAIAAIEARNAQEAEAAGLKAALRETLQELNSDITDEEIAEEVRKQRKDALERQAHQLRQTEKTKLRRRRRAKIITLFAVPLFLIGLVNGVNRYHDAQREQWQRIAQLEKQHRSSPVPASLTRDTLVLDKSNGKSTVRTLAEIPEGRAVQVNFKDLLAGKRQTASDLLMSASSKDNLWYAVKHGGRVYLRGWLVQSMSEQAIRQGRFYMTNVEFSGENSTTKTRPDGTITNEPLFIAKQPVPVTLPVDGLRFNDVGALVDCYMYFQVSSGANPDAHLNETWK